MKFKQQACKDDGTEEEKVCFGFGILFIACLLGFYGIVYALDHMLPTPLEIKDEANYPDSFIAERAKKYLKPLVDIGPKVTGSHENEVLAVNYIISVINEIKRQANPVQEIELDLQVASGSIYLSAYANLQNIVVKVHSANNTQHSVLINTHFDSVPSSPGGSDDGVNVAIALEVFRKISQSPNKPRNNVIFLFNGAEEVGLKASHAFITRHKWRDEVKVLVNLEATGAGGKEILFQTGPDRPWLLKYYDVPHPHGNAGAEEIFQSNVIPSDTDFRIFRDYGGVIGYDFAYTRDGYRYHTKFDGFDNIDYGTYQHTGDNILQLVRNLADAPEVSANESDLGKTVFFDFIGLFHIQYGADVAALIINILVMVISVLILVWACISYKNGLLSALIYLLLSMLLQLLGIVVACAFVLLIGIILDGAVSTMSWYKIPAMIFLLYVAPTVFCQLLTSIVTQRFIGCKGQSLKHKVFLQIHANRLLWTIVLLIGTAFELRIIYLIMIPVLFNAITMCIIDIFKLYNYHGSIWFSVYIIFSVLPTMKVMYMGHEALALFIPIMGRFGNDTNPEIFVGLLVALITIKVTSYFVPLFFFIRRQWCILLVVWITFIVGFILAFTPVGFPYQFSEDQPRPQRYDIYHIQRIYNSESGEIIKDNGFYFGKEDRNNIHAIQSHVTSLEKAQSGDSLRNDCVKLIACGFPYVQPLENVVWIPTSEPPVFPTPLDYVCSSESVALNLKRYQCSISGSDRLGVYISIRRGAELTWLSTAPRPGYSFIWKNQPTYRITLTSGKEAHPLEFQFLLEKKEGFSGPAVDLGVYATYVHQELNQLTPEYERFLREFPNWAAISNGLVHFEMIAWL